MNPLHEKSNVADSHGSRRRDDGCGIPAASKAETASALPGADGVQSDEIKGEANLSPTTGRLHTDNCGIGPVAISGFRLIKGPTGTRHWVFAP